MGTSEGWPVPVKPLGRVAVGTVLWRFVGQLNLTVIVKACFTYQPDEAMTLADPEPLRVADEGESDWPLAAVRHPRENAPQLPGVDVLLVGDAHGRPSSRRRSVRLVIGRDDDPVLDKTLEVVGDREDEGEPESFEIMPLDYSRTWGGIGNPDNPLGVGAGPNDTQLPNVIDPAHPKQAAGFGPIPPAFPCRKKRLGKWSRSKLQQEIAELPTDFDWAYFLCAPPDQRLDSLRGDESIELEGLDAEAEKLATQLPGLRAVTHVYGHERADAPATVPLVLDMLHIEADERRCSLVWRGSLPVSSASEAKQLVIAGALEGPGEIVEWPDELATAGEAPPKRARPRPAPIPPVAHTSTLELAPEMLAGRPKKNPTTPFRAKPPAATSPAPPPAAVRPPEAPPAATPAAEPAPLRVAPIAATNDEPDHASPWAAGPSKGGKVAPVAVPGIAAGGPRPRPLAGASSRASTSDTADTRARTAGRPTAKAIRLVWLDADRIDRIYDQPRWASLIDDLEDRPADPELDAGGADDELEDEQRAVFELLARAKITHLEHLPEVFRSGVRPDGRFAPPLVLTAGELELSLDDTQQLEALLTLVRPDAAADERLQKPCDAAADALRTPPVPKELATQLSAELREAFRRGGKRLFDPAELDGFATRMLLEQGHLQRRAVFGGSHLRARLCPYESGPRAPMPIVAYLPAAAAEQLPLYPRFDARVIAELHMGQDEQESHLQALRVVALAQVLRLRQ